MWLLLVVLLLTMIVMMMMMFEGGTPCSLGRYMHWVIGQGVKYYVGTQNGLILIYDHVMVVAAVFYVLVP